MHVFMVWCLTELISLLSTLNDVWRIQMWGHTSRTTSDAPPLSFANTKDLSSICRYDLIFLLENSRHSTILESWIAGKSLERGREHFGRQRLMTQLRNAVWWWGGPTGFNVRGIPRTGFIFFYVRFQFNILKLYPPSVKLVSLSFRQQSLSRMQSRYRPTYTKTSTRVWRRGPRTQYSFRCVCLFQLGRHSSTFVYARTATNPCWSVPTVLQPSWNLHTRSHENLKSTRTNLHQNVEFKFYKCFLTAVRARRHVKVFDSYLFLRGFRVARRPFHDSFP